MAYRDPETYGVSANPTRNQREVAGVWWTAAASAAR